MIFEIKFFWHVISTQCYFPLFIYGWVLANTQLCRKHHSQNWGPLCHHKQPCSGYPGPWGPLLHLSARGISIFKRVWLWCTTRNAAFTRISACSRWELLAFLESKHYECFMTTNWEKAALLLTVAALFQHHRSREGTSSTSHVSHSGHREGTMRMWSGHSGESWAHPACPNQTNLTSMEMGTHSQYIRKKD